MFNWKELVLYYLMLSCISRTSYMYVVCIFCELLCIVYVTEGIQHIVAANHTAAQLIAVVRPLSNK